MGISLYDHNQIAYESVRNTLAATGRAAVIHPTGTGKSFIAFKFCEDNPDKTVLWLSPSEYIFRTQVENLKEAGADVPENISFYTYSRFSMLEEGEIAGISAGAVILDEFHRCGAPVWQVNISKLLRLFPDIPVIGLTATAVRYLDNRRDMSSELFDGNVASEMTLGEAIVRGILSPPKYVLSAFSYQKDLERYKSRVRSARNRAVRDAAEKYLEALRRALEMADGLDEVFDKHMTDRTGKYIVFCAGKEHMDEMIGKAGEWFARVDKCPHIYSVYSEDPSASKSFADFKADSDDTHLRLLYCIDALNEGIHVDDISGVILLRPTISPIIYKQQIGRALSARGQKEPVIFDIVMNIDNLCSIDTVQEEMRIAMTYYRRFSGAAEIVNDKFRVIDRLGDCRELFRKLNDTLTASWEMMYSFARQYFETYGHLNVPGRYKTPDGYSLGHWITTQRRVYHGEIFGVLDEGRIAKLDAVGMDWDSSSMRTWKQNYSVAKAYYEANGDLRVPADYVTDTGIRLGNWIRNLRTCYKSKIRPRFLTEQRIGELNGIGMIWDVPDYIWEQNYGAAMAYHRAHGNLDVPSEYVTTGGLRLGAWLDNMRSARKNGSYHLTSDQIQKLNDLGMMWERPSVRKWETAYAAAKEYYTRNKNLNIPYSYKSEDGFPLGCWIARQREKYRSGTMKQEKIDRLNAIGMIWQKEDPWEVRFKLAEKYFMEHGSLKMPGNYKADGVCLGKWVNEQKQSYRGNRPKQKLTKKQISRLESIGMEWRNPNEVIWDTRYHAVKDYFDSHGNIDIPKDAVLSDGRPIGAWLILQRSARKRGHLSDRQVAMLDTVHMTWENALSV